MSVAAFERFSPKKGAGGQKRDGVGGGGPAQGSPSLLASSPQPTKILQDVLDCIESIKKGFEEDGNPIDDNNQTLHRMCAKLEYLLQADMKEKKTITGKKKDYWEYFCECLSSIKGVNDGIKYVKTTGDCKTSLGKGRAFLRFCLMHHRLADSLQQCSTNGKVTSAWYGPSTIWLQYDKSSLVINALYDLNDVLFDLAPRGYDLDNSWPSFARKNAESQQSWSLSERARTMSLTSLNSIGLDTPTKSMMSSTPSDTSGIEYLAQELAVSENVRSDLTDKMEALQQQKTIFQQTVAESRGEMNMLDTQLKQLQMEHKELQAAHREMEKKYDRLCMESEVKDRDGKTQESFHQSMVSELSAENEKLEIRITQIEEDLQLAQENEELTTSERDAVKTELQDLNCKKEELERAFEIEKLQFDEKVKGLQVEKSDLIEKLKSVEGEEDQRKQSESDVRNELKDQTCLVVKLEKKLSALTSGYQWLNTLKNGAEFTEISDLDATFALILKDVSHFAHGMQDKISTETIANEKLREENSTLTGKVTEFQQEASICKEKVVTMETFIHKVQDNENSLKQKVLLLEDAVSTESEKLSQLKDQLVQKDKLLADSKSKIASIESDKERAFKDIEMKDKELATFKEEIEKHKSELQKTSEFYNLATKGHSELMEKLKTQEKTIQKKNEKVLEVIEREKQYIEEKNALLRDKEREQLLKENVEHDKTKLADQLLQLQGVCQELKEELTSKENENRELSTHNDISKKKIIANEKESSKLKDLMEKEEIKSTELKKTLEDERKEMEIQIMSINEEKNKLMLDLTSLHTQVSHHEREVSVLNEKRDYLETTVNKMQKNESDLNVKIQNLEKELNAKSLYIVSVEKDIEMKVKEAATFEEEKNTLKLEVTKFQDQFYEKKSAVLLLQEKMERSKEELERTKDFYESAAKTESELSERFKILENNLHEKDRRISELTEVEKALTVEVSKLSRDKEDLMKNFERVQINLDNLRIGYQDKENQIESQLIKIGDINVEKETLTRRVEELGRQNTDIHNQLDKMKAELEENLIERNELKQMERECKVEKERTEKDNRILEQSIYDNEQKEKELIKTLDEMKKDFENAVKEKEDLEEKLADLEQKSKENKTDIDQLRSECDTILQQKDKIKDEKDQNEKLIKEGNDQFQKLKSECSVISHDKYELEEKLDILELERQENSATICCLRKEIEAGDEERENLTLKIKELEENSAKDNERIEDINSNITGLKNEELKHLKSISNLEHDKQEMILKIEALNIELESFSQQLVVKEEQIMCLKETESERNTLIESMKKDSSEIEQKDQKLADDILVLQEKEMNNVDTIKKLEETIQRTEIEKESLQSLLSLKSVEINELQARFDDFQSENSCLVQEYDLLQQSFNDLKVTEEVVRAKLSEMTTDRDELNTEMLGVKELLKCTQVELHLATCEKEKLTQEKNNNEKVLGELRDGLIEESNTRKEMEAIYAELSSKNKQLESQLQDTKNELDVKASEGKYLHCQVEKLNEVHNEMSQANVKLIANKNEQHYAICELNEKLTKLSNCEKDLEENLKVCAQLKCDLDRVTKEKDEISSVAEEKKQDLNNIIIELERDKEQLTLEIKSERKQTVELQSHSDENSILMSQLTTELETVKNEKENVTKTMETEMLELKNEANQKDKLQEEKERLLSEIQSLVEKEKETQQVYFRLKNELEDVKNKNTTLQSNHLESLNEISNLQEQLKILYQDREVCVTELRQTTADLEFKRSNLVKNLEEASNDLHSLKELLSHTSLELEHAYEEKVELERSMVEIKQNNRTLEQNLTSSQINNTQKDEKLEELKKDVEELQTGNYDLKVKKEKEESKIQLLTEEIMSVKDTFALKLKEKESEIIILKDTIFELKASVESSEDKERETSAEKEALMEMKIKQAGEITEKEQKLNETAETTAKISYENEILSKKILLLEQNFIEKNEAFEKLNTELKSSIEDKNKLKQQINSLQEINKTVSDVEAQYNHKIEEFALQNNGLTATNAELVEKHENVKHEMEQMQQEISSLEARLKDTDAKIESIESENEKKARDSEVEMDSLQQEVQSLEFQLSSQQLEQEQSQKEEGQFNEMKERLMEQEALIEQLQKEMKDLQTMAQKEREQELLIERLKMDNESKVSENLALRDELNKLQEDLQHQMTSSVSVKHNYDDEKERIEKCVREKDEEISQLKEDLDQLKKKLVKLIKEKDTLWQKTDRLAFQQKLQATEKWMDDGKVTHCLGCSTEFSFTLRKHHCRLCGRIFCHNCSSNWVFTAHSSKKSRACTSCFIHFNSVSEEDTNKVLNSDDVEASVEIAPQVMGTTLSPNVMNSSMASSVSSDQDSSYIADSVSSSSHKLVYDMALPSNCQENTTSQLDVSGNGASGDNETDEDKLKDTVTNIGSDERGDNGDDRFHVVSDEEIQKSLSMSGDHLEPPAPLDPSMESCVCISLEELERDEVSCQNEVWIKPGKSYIVPVLINTPNTVFGWQFSSYPKDVVFSVVYRKSQSVTFKDGQELVPPCKCDSHKQVTKGELTTKQSGLYTLIFDNTYSRLTSKRINYTLMSTPLQTE